MPGPPARAGAEATDGRNEHLRAAEDDSHNIGLLTRTVFSSPEAHWILPAKVRPVASDGQAKNDVAFVGSRSVEIREILPAGNLCRVASRNDFGARILCAGVLDTRFLTPNSSIGTTASTIKHEGKDESQPSLPPQLLLLTLDSHELLFVYLDTAYDRPTDFLIRSIALPTGDSVLQRPGPYLATDPDSRALAVAAYMDRMIVYDTNVLDPEGCQANDVIKDSTIIYLEPEYTVLQLAFLPTVPGHESTIHLLLSGIKDQKTKLMLYTWSCERRLVQNAVTLSHTQTLSRELGVPSLLIPLNIANAPGSFMIVSETSMAMYSGIHIRHAQPSPPLKFYQCDSKGVLDSRETVRIPQGDSRSLPLWTAWTRPQRNNNSYDDLYLGREDGLVWYVHIEKRHDRLEMTRRGEAGRVHGNIGNAFTSFHLGLHVGDTIMFGGEMSNGGFYEIGQMFPTEVGSPEAAEYERLSRVEIMDLKKKDVFHNWTPFLDVATVAGLETNQGPRDQPRNGHNANASPSSARQYHDVFATSGKNSSGSICQLRYGLEVPLRIQLTIDPGASHLWALRADQTQDFIIISRPDGSAALTGISSNQSLVDQHDLGEEPTLVASNLWDSRHNLNRPVTKPSQWLTLQITPSRVNLLVFTDIDDLDVSELWYCPGISVAAIEPSTQLVFLAYRKDVQTLVTFQKLSFASSEYVLSDIGKHLLVDFETTCACFFPTAPVSLQGKDTDIGHVGISGPVHVAMGTTDGRIVIIRVDNQGDTSIVFDRSLHGQDTNMMEWSCESIAVVDHIVVPKEERKRRQLLLCGTRNGFLYDIDLEIDRSSPHVERIASRCTHIGSTGVRVQPDLAVNAAAFVYCDTDVCHFSYSLNPHKTNPVMIQNVWFVNRQDASFSHGVVAALTQVPKQIHGSKSRMAENVVCISGDSLFSGPVERSARPLPRRWPTEGTPNRVVYSSMLKKLVVATTMIQVDAKTKKRASVPFLYATDLMMNHSQNRLNDSYYGDARLAANPTLLYRGLPGEKISSIIEWSAAPNDKRYEFIVASTVCRRADGTEYGGLRYIRFRGGVFQQHSESQESDPIMSMCSYGKDSFLYCCGDKVKLRTLTPEMKFQKETVHRLNSRGLHISVEGQLIYVTTARHSLVSLRYVDGALVPGNSDSVSREGLYHLNLPERSLVLLSDKTGGVTGFGLTKEKRASHFEMKFNAQLSWTMTRLFKASMAPVWRQRSSVGIVEGNIYGTSTDGALISFTVLDSAAWRLLRFIQNMCLRDATICRSQVHSAFIRSHLDPDDANPAAHHVDGDVLSRLVERGDAWALLNSMLDRIPLGLDNLNRVVDFNTVEERRSRFKELLRNVVEGPFDEEHDNAAFAREEPSLTSQDEVGTALRVVRGVLESPF